MNITTKFNLGDSVVVITRWYVIVHGVVGRVEYRATNGAGEEFKYMLTDTGSGSVYDERNLFATSDEATVECDRRNADYGDAPWERDQ